VLITHHHLTVPLKMVFLVDVLHVLEAIQQMPGVIVLIIMDLVIIVVTTQFLLTVKIKIIFLVDVQLVALVIQ